MADPIITEPTDATPPVAQVDNANTPPASEQGSSPEISFDLAGALDAAITAAAEKEKEQPPVAEEKPKAETPAPEAKPADAKPAGPKPEDTVTDEELAPSPHDKPKTQARFKALHSKWKTAEEKAAAMEKAASEREARIKELEEKSKLTPAATQELEDLKKAREETAAKAKVIEDELLQYKRLYEVERLPEIEERFVKPAKLAEERIASTLKGYGLGDATLAEIQKHGGLAAFAKSPKTYQVKDENGESVTISASEVVDDWLKRMNFTDRETVKSLVGEQSKLEIQKQAYLESERARAKDHFASLSKKQQEEQAQLTAAQEANKKKVKDWVDTQFANDEDLKDVEGEDKAERAEARNRLVKFLSTATQEELLEAAKVAAKAPVTAKRLAAKDALIAQLQTQLKEREAELDKVRNGGRSTPATNARAVGATPPAKKQALDLQSLLTRDGGSALEAAIGSGE